MQTNIPAKGLALTQKVADGVSVPSSHKQQDSVFTDEDDPPSLTEMKMKRTPNVMNALCVKLHFKCIYLAKVAWKPVWLVTYQNSH